MDEQKLEIALELLAGKMSAAEDIMDLEPPSWAGAPGTLYGTYDFAEAQWTIEDGWRLNRCGIKPLKGEIISSALIPHQKSLVLGILIFDIIRPPTSVLC